MEDKIEQLRTQVLKLNGLLLDPKPDLIMWGALLQDLAQETIKTLQEFVPKKLEVVGHYKVLPEAHLADWFNCVHGMAESVRAIHEEGEVYLTSDLNLFAVERTLNSVLGKPVELPEPVEDDEVK